MTQYLAQNWHKKSRKMIKLLIQLKGTEGKIMLIYRRDLLLWEKRAQTKEKADKFPLSAPN